MIVAQNSKPIILLICTVMTLLLTSCALEQRKQFKNIAEEVIVGNANSVEGIFPGGVLFDYDNDNDLDILLTGGIAEGKFLYQNQGVDKKGDIQFRDVSEDSGIVPPKDRFKYAQGACYADIDNDGDQDLYVLFEETIEDKKDSNDGYNALYRNNGDGTFTDITRAAKVTDQKETGVSCSFADVNNDGYVDLYIANYIDADLFQMGKQSFLESKNTLFLNNKDNTFTDITRKAFPEVRPSKNKEWLSFVSCFSDYDNDNDQDLFVMNDMGPLQLFENDGAGIFADVSKEAGLGTGGGWMGCTLADINNDGNQDLFATNIGGTWLFNMESIMGKMNLSSEISSNTIWHVLLQNTGDRFQDITEKTKLETEYDLESYEEFFEGGGFAAHGKPSKMQGLEWGWGATFVDYDLDGDQDIMYASNFGMMGVIASSERGAGPGRLLRNDGDKSHDNVIDFTDVTKELGLYNTNKYGNFLDGRTIIKGDLDNDGDQDIVLINSGSKMMSLEDRTNSANRGSIAVYQNPGFNNNWIGIKLVGTKSNRDGIGAKVSVDNKKKKQTIEVRAGSGLSSQHDIRPYFGVGKAKEVDIVVQWPSGIVQELGNIAVNQIVTVTEKA